MSSHSSITLQSDLTIDAGTIWEFSGNAIWIISDANLNNNGQVLVTVPGSATAISGTIGTSFAGKKIVNAGLIQVTAGWTPIPGNDYPLALGLATSAYLPEIWNTATGQIVVSGYYAYGIDSNDHTHPITNDGLIRVTGNVFAMGMRLQSFGFHVTNAGRIEVHNTSGEGAFGINFQGYDGTFINTGTIEVTADQDSNKAVGIQAWGSQQTVLNNSGTITAGRAIVIGGGSTTNNSGTINGKVELGGKSEFLNAGTINGSVTFGAGDDLYDSEHGTCSGLVDGGAGNNTVICNRSDAATSIVFAAPADTAQQITLPDGTQAVNFQNYRITSGAGNDTLTGGAGADTFEGGTGDDTLVGGAGTDTVVYAHASGGVTVDLSLTTAQAIGGGQGTDMVSGCENIIGSNYSDTLRGTAGANVITPNGGDDVIQAGDGNDTIYMGAYFTAADRIDAGAGQDTVFLQGDYSQGITLSNAVLAGVETLNLGTDDYLHYNGSSYKFKFTTTNDLVAAGQVLSLNARDYRTVAGLTFDGSAETDGSFNIVGSYNSDNIVLGAGNDIVDGYGGADTIDAHLGGNDVIANGTVLMGASFTADDQLRNATVVLDGDYSAGVVCKDTTLAGFIKIVVKAGHSYKIKTTDASLVPDPVAWVGEFVVDGSQLGPGDVLNFDASLEINGAYRMIGGAGNDVFAGGSGTNTYIGNDGIDTVDFSSATQGVTVDQRKTDLQQIIVRTTSSQWAQLSSIENITGSAYNDTLTGNSADNVLAGGDGDDTLSGGGGSDTLFGGNGNDTLKGDGSDILAGGAGDDTLDGSAGSNAASYQDATSGVAVSLAIIGAQAIGGGQGSDTLISIASLVGSNYGDTLIGDGGSNALQGRDGDDVVDGGAGNDVISGGAGTDTLNGGADEDTITGGAGNDTLDGGSSADTAVFSGNKSGYTITQTSTGKFTVAGPDGTDSLTNIEYAKFDDQTMRLLPGTGTTVNFANDPSTYMAAIRDFDGTDLGGTASWKLIGSADINGDGRAEHIFFNREIGRWAEVGTEADGLTYFANNGWAGDTRVVGIYIDPLVANGTVVKNSDFDSQRRFQNDLMIDNIRSVLGQGDYDHNGLQEVYFSLTDGTAYLHAYMHADGNIQYANYQSKQQVIDYLTSNGVASSTWATWFPSGQSVMAAVAG